MRQRLTFMTALVLLTSAVFAQPTPTPVPLTLRTEGSESGGFIYVEIHLDGTAALTGLTLRLHFDTTQLLFGAVEQVIHSSIGKQFLSDYQDFDNDPTTDGYVTFGWAGQNWPGTAATHLLARVRFVPIGTPDTTLRISLKQMPLGHQVDAPSFDIPEDLN